MAQAKASLLKTFGVALILSGVCSVLVTSSVVLLGDLQQENMLIFKRANVLRAAGFDVSTEEVNVYFQEKIELRYFNLHTGEYVEAPSDPQFDSVEAAKDPNYSENITGKKDIARIKRRSKISEVYFLRDSSEGNKNVLNRIILPVRGKGLWSTMKGFMAIDPSTFQVQGLSFYSHAETPGLGGEIDNPKWLAQWPQKKIYDSSGKVKFMVLKGSVLDSDPDRDYHVDGLSGATLTSVGVTKMVMYWFGQEGYHKFLTQQRDLGWK